MSAPRLDFTDPAAVAKWLRNVRVAVDDAESVTLDMLKPLAKRDLGRRLHREQFREARKAMAQLLDYATPDPEPSDPAGSSGPPCH